MRGFATLAGLLSFGLSVLFSAEGETTHPPIWAFYYAWYETPQGPHQTWKMWAEKTAHGEVHSRIPAKPLIGEYDSTNPAVVKWHFQLAEAAGIDAFLVSWWGGANISGQAFTDVILPAASQSKVKVALNCELAQFHADIHHLAQQVSTVLLKVKDQPGYLHQDGKPVLYLYQVPFDPKLTPESFKILHDEVEKNVGPVWWAMDKIAHHHGEYAVPLSWQKTPNLDGLGFYGTFSIKRISSEAELTPFFQHYAASVRNTQAKLLLPLHPALDNSVIQPSTAFRIPSLKGETLQGYHNAALAAQADIILLTSFNEWPEGTMIEPIAQTEDPYLFLKIIARWKKRDFVAPPLPTK